MKNTEQNIPQSFLTHCSSGQWAVIHNGLPLCAETTKEFALSTAARYKLTLPEVYWEAASAEFMPNN